MRTHATSDTHFDHAALILATRPPDFEEMILDRINTQVARADRLIIVGDFAIKRPGYWRQRIRCRNVMLIRGNHDPVAKCKHVFGGNYRETYMGKLCGHPTWFSHYPHAYWPSSHHGAFHCYGHEHDQREETLDALFPGRRSQDLSPETYLRQYGVWGIFAEEQLHSRLIALPGHDFISFYRNFRECRAATKPDGDGRKTTSPESSAAGA